MGEREVREALEAALEALTWCGGSSDFAPRGKARLGWERLVIPAREKCMGALAALDAAPEGEHDFVPAGLSGHLHVYKCRKCGSLRGAKETCVPPAPPTEEEVAYRDRAELYARQIASNDYNLVGRIADGLVVAYKSGLAAALARPATPTEGEG